MDISNSLTLTALITRPEPHASQLATQLKEQHIDCLIFPVINILAPPALTEINEHIKDADQYDWVIITSAHVLRHITLEPLQRLKHAKVAAIGQKTQHALEQHAIRVAFVPPEPAGSDALLASDTFQSLRDQRILLLSGVGGRTHLTKSLQSQDNHVVKLECYQRIRPKAPRKESILSWQRNPFMIIICMSNESIDNLVALVGNKTRTWLLNQPLLVASQRQYQHAVAIGFIKPALVVKEISDAGIIHTMLAWQQSERKKHE